LDVEQTIGIVPKILINGRYCLPWLVLLILLVALTKIHLKERGRQQNKAGRLTRQSGLHALF